MSIFTEHILNIARTSPWLAIKAGWNVAAKIGNETVYTIDWVIYSILWQDIDLTGIDIEDWNHCIISVFADKSLVVSVEKSEEKVWIVWWAMNRFTTSEIVRDEDKALLWTIWLYNWTGDDFTWWTTALDESGMQSLYVNNYSSLGL